MSADDHATIGALEVRWQTVYNLFDQAGNATLTETEQWTMREANGTFVLGLEWRGQAKTDVTIGSADTRHHRSQVPGRQRWTVPAAALAQRPNSRTS